MSSARRNSVDLAALSSAEDLDYNIPDTVHARYLAARELRYKGKQPDAQTNEAFRREHDLRLYELQAGREHYLSEDVRHKMYATAIKWAMKFADNGHAFRYRCLDDVWDIAAADTSSRYSNAEWFKKKNKAVER
ncbi:hypothetical protein E4U12_008261 [Claviceps purpurea]|nr:hypothetical protein E4U12_008261 [Claviceps purpurea]